ncbi:MAG: hypothetical protein NTV80_22150 [Verrucomicrobia bacterium]|nr:hypothetical protein [Verrucomicrobiota bacterium]
MRTALLLLLLGLLPACETFKGDPKVVITVFSEGNEMDSPKSIFRRPVEGENKVFKVIPEFTTNSVVAFHPFAAKDGTNGVAVKLDFKGANALELVTRMRQGEILHINESQSSAESIDMIPSTKAELKDNYREAKKAREKKLKDEAAAAQRAARGEFEPETPKGEAVPLSEALKSAR